MSSVAEFISKVKENFALSEMPGALEIKNPDRRNEFLRDYERLVGRCGQAAMNGVFHLYLTEQKIENGEIKSSPKISFIGYNNTAEIIARFIDNGWANYSLSDKPLTEVTDIVWDKKDKPIMVSSFHSHFITHKVKEEGIPEFLAPEIKRVKSAKENSTLIPPWKIREVFAEIDAQYELHQE